MNPEETPVIRILIPVYMRCEVCNKIMTKLPTTLVCLNKKCDRAGILYPRGVGDNLKGETR